MDQLESRLQRLLRLYRLVVVCLYVLFLSGALGGAINWEHFGYTTEQAFSTCTLIVGLAAVIVGTFLIFVCWKLGHSLKSLLLWYAAAWVVFLVVGVFSPAMVATPGHH
jgi:hypothetical protein